MATGSEIRVTFGALTAAQSDVAGAAARITAQLDDLKRFLTPLVATWSGVAADGYQTNQRQWDKSAADLTAVLAQIGVALGAAHDSYQQVEAANAARWR